MCLGQSTFWLLAQHNYLNNSQITEYTFTEMPHWFGVSH